MRRSNESGYASILVLGFTLIAIGVAGVAIDGTRAFLYRQSIQNAADAAALAGASEVDRQSYYASSGRDLKLDPAAARSKAAEWLGLRGIDAAIQIETSEDNVRVILRSQIDTTFLRVIGVGSVPVGVESLARPIAGDP